MREDNSTVELVDIRTVKVEPSLPKQEKIVEYVRQIKDPYHYKCGRFTITECHPLTGPTIEECFQGMMA